MDVTGISLEDVSSTKVEGGQHDACQAVRPVLSRVGDKWSMFIVMSLGDGPVRFNELKRRSMGISQRMLSLTLRNLEQDGLVSRQVTPSVPIRVDYALTDLGHSLAEPVRQLSLWAQAHHAEMEAARVRYRLPS